MTGPAVHREGRCVRAALGALTICLLLAGSVGVASAPGASMGLEVETYSLAATNEGGSADTQAGSHPYELQAEVALASTGAPADEVKDLDFELPAGLNLDPEAAYRCSVTELAEGACSNTSAVGLIQIRTANETVLAPVYNVAPSPGGLATLGFKLEGALVRAPVSVRAGDYGMTVSIDDIPHRGVKTLKLTLWGAPAESGHDEQRGSCLTGPKVGCAGGPDWPFITLPTRCAQAPETIALAESWGAESDSRVDTLPRLTGCEALSLRSAIEVAPVVPLLDEPSGYALALRLAQGEELADELAPAQLQQAVFVLPRGVSFSPNSLDGVSGCSETELGPGSAQPAMCPDAAKVGTAELDTPLLDNRLGQPQPLTGAVYIAAPEGGVVGAPAALYVVVKASGLVIKLVAAIELNEATGQVMLSFKALPQLPIREIALQFFGGPRALLANPLTCGQSTAEGNLELWSGGAQAAPSSTFAITGQGPGDECADAALFEPTLEAGSVDASAGSYSPLTLTVVSHAPQQSLARLAFALPAGLSLKLANVPLCGQAQADAGDCPPTSRIGSATLLTGPGPDALPFTGAVYLTEGYGDAAYGLSIPIEALAGPFDLGEVVLRATLAPGPATGATAISIDPLPLILDGIPLRTQVFNMTIERPEFVLNPSICGPRQITATIEGSASTTVQTANPFETSGCLPFLPSTGGSQGEAPQAQLRSPAHRSKKASTMQRCEHTTTRHRRHRAAHRKLGCRRHAAHKPRRRKCRQRCSHARRDTARGT